MKRLAHYTIGLMLLISCNQKSKTMKTSECQRIIETSLTEGNIVPHGKLCQLGVLENSYDIKSENAVTSYLGTEARPYSLWQFCLDSDSSIEIKVYAINESVKKIERWETIDDKSTNSKLLNTLGPPDLKLDYYFDVIKMNDKLWVYPSKGLALYFGMLENIIYGISYFEPTDVETYRRELYKNQTPREF